LKFELSPQAIAQLSNFSRTLFGNSGDNAAENDGTENVIYHA